MARKVLGAVTPATTLNQLAHFVDALQERAEAGRGARVRSHGEAGGGKGFARMAMGGSADLGNMQVYGVRDTKDSLSKILNDASSGDLAFIEAGRGGAVVVISTDTLAGVITSLEERRDLTLANALERLPYRPTEMAKVKVKGRVPHRGLLRGARAAHRSAPSSGAET